MSTGCTNKKQAMVTTTDHLQKAFIVLLAVLFVMSAVCSETVVTFLSPSLAKRVLHYRPAQAYNAYQKSYYWPTWIQYYPIFWEHTVGLSMLEKSSPLLLFFSFLSCCDAATTSAINLIGDSWGDFFCCSMTARMKEAESMFVAHRVPNDPRNINPWIKKDRPFVSHKNKSPLILSPFLFMMPWSHNGKKCT